MFLNGRKAEGTPHRGSQLSWEKEPGLTLLKRCAVHSALLEREGALDTLLTGLRTQQSVAGAQAKGPACPDQLCDLSALVLGTFSRI